MHIPDAMIDGKTAVATAALATAGLGLALRQARLHLPQRRVPLMGLAAAFIFAAQMLNFPVIAGTSGHLIGGVLAAVLLGPSAAVIVMTAVLTVQCLMFSDGGITALGANVFNMAIVSTVGGYAAYRLVRTAFGGRRGQILAACFAAWCGTVLASVACAGEIALSGKVQWAKALTAMGGIHMLIGIGEGLITGMALVAIAGLRPELLPERQASSDAPRYGAVAAYVLLIALGLAMFVSPLASEWPDGLEWVAERLGFAQGQEHAAVLPAPMPDYQAPWIESPAVATSVAGAVGTLVVFGLFFVIAHVLVPGAAPPPATTQAPGR